ncbi:MAG: hypothetical protein KatS3mg104_0418 [Phycisphaerae bacterium]|jgi:hypothetical protein|nr:MAG: hypothetical protein KatS3mg104_0418 [Phycisphaerae bacterium]
MVLLLADPVAGTMRTYETRHYRIESDLEPAVVRDYAKRLDAMYEEYSRRLADFTTPSGQKFNVYLFQKRSDYIRFTGNRVPNSAGIFIPAQRALAGFEEGQGRTGLRQTLQHEAFHQFAWEVISPNLPIWLDEGLAQIFEEGVWTGNQFILGQVPPRRITELREDIRQGRMIPFRKFMSMSREDFQSRMKDPRTGRAQYNQAWAMTHFLIFAAGNDGAPRYRSRLLACLRDIHNGQSPDEAFVANFSDNIEGFEARFSEWASQLTPTPMAVYSDRMSKLAELLRIFYEEGKRFDSIQALRDHLSRGRYHLTEQRDGQTLTYEENALTYLSDLSNTPWPTEVLRLQKRRGPLPDIVLSPPGQSQIRVRFYEVDRQILYDLAFEMR